MIARHRLLSHPGGQPPPRLRGMDAPPIQYARTEDGSNIAYFVVWSAPTLIHSPWLVGSIAQEWDIPPIRAWYERLAEHYRLVRSDRRGQGASGRAAPRPLGFSDPGTIRDSTVREGRCRSAKPRSPVRIRSSPPSLYLVAAGMTARHTLSA